MSYEGPIMQIMSDIQYRCEEDCVKVVQSYGFDVDKKELTKALLYDRNQYEEGYQQGKEDAESKYICHEDCTSESCSMCIRWNRLSDCYEVEK